MCKCMCVFVSVCVCIHVCVKPLRQLRTEPCRLWSICVMCVYVYVCVLKPFNKDNKK